MENTTVAISRLSNPLKRSSIVRSAPADFQDAFSQPQCAGRRMRTLPARGFTLVELLITITIIGIMSGMLLFALGGAAESARVDKTKSIIAKLNNLIMPRYEAYRTRRVPIQVAVTGPSAVTVQAAAQTRLNGLHELMRFEMPECWLDVTDTPTIVAIPALSQGYRRAYANNINPVTHAVTPPTTVYENAETLYLIVTLGAVDELGGRSLFNESNIGDVDQDGAREFLDAWGTPIRFLRWAPAFVSDMQPVASASSPRYQFDPRGLLGAPPLTYAIYPLIYSAGHDGVYSVVGESGQSGAGGLNPFYSLTAGTYPYGPVGKQVDISGESATSGWAAGMNGWLDNIHNQLMGTR